MADKIACTPRRRRRWRSARMTVENLADQMFPYLTVVEGLKLRGADLQQGREAAFLPCRVTAHRNRLGTRPRYAQIRLDSGVGSKVYSWILTERLHPRCRPGHGMQRSLEMTAKRKVEVFSAGCPACEDVVSLVRGLACPSCEVDVLDMRDIEVAKRAKALGVQSVPAVAINGQLAGCCTGRGVGEASLRAAGLGQP
jgi:glutaredoxin 3